MSLTKQEKEKLNKEFKELDQKLHSKFVIEKIVKKLNEIEFMGFDDWQYLSERQGFLGGSIDYMSLGIAIKIAKYERFFDYLIEG